MNEPIYAYASYTHIFLAVFFIVLTFINKDIRGIIWLAGAVLSSFISHVAINTIKTDKVTGGSDREGRPSNCYTKNFSYKLWNESHPALSSNVITFTLSYVLFPMLSVNKINPIVIAGLVLLFIMDAYKKISDNSETCKVLSSDIIVIGIIGLGVGYMWYKILKDTNNERMFYFNEFLSTNEICSKPSNTQFKCRVYKNGELIANL